MKLLLAMLCVFCSAFLPAGNTIVNSSENTNNVTGKGGNVNSGINLGDEKSGAIHGDGQLKKENRAIPPFEMLEVSGISSISIDCAGRDSKKPSITISAEGNILPLISTKLEDGILKIGFEKPVSATKEMSIILCAPPAFTGCSVAGSGHLRINALDSKSFHLKNSGNWKIEISGGSSELQVESTGSTSLDASHLKVEKASILAKGSGEMNINASSLALDITGPVKVRCKGKPRILSQKILGGSLETE